MLLNKFIPSLSVLVPGLMIWACSGIDTAGTSEESEGIVALAGKRVSGAAQKGPLVKGSGVILRETSAEGNLEPTGFYLQKASTLTKKMERFRSARCGLMRSPIWKNAIHQISIF